MAVANLTIKSYQIVGIHKICPYETTILCEGSRFLRDGKVHQSYRRMPLQTEVTHEVHFSAKRFVDAVQNVVSPQQAVAMVVWFSAASAVGRPSSSKALVWGDDIYYMLTYTDILGSGHGKQCDLHRVRSNRLVYFLQAVSNLEHKQLIFDRIVEMWGADRAK